MNRSNTVNIEIIALGAVKAKNRAVTKVNPKFYKALLIAIYGLPQLERRQLDL